MHDGEFYILSKGIVSRVVLVLLMDLYFVAIYDLFYLHRMCFRSGNVSCYQSCLITCHNLTSQLFSVEQFAKQTIC